MYNILYLTLIVYSFTKFFGLVFANEVNFRNVAAESYNNKNN